MTGGLCLLQERWHGGEGSAGWGELCVSLARGMGCNRAPWEGSPTQQVVVPVSGLGWYKPVARVRQNTVDMAKKVMEWSKPGVGGAAVVAVFEWEVLGTTGSGCGGSSAGFPITPRAHLLSPGVARLCLGYPHPCRRIWGTQDYIHPPPFLLCMLETCSWVYRRGPHKAPGPAVAFPDPPGEMAEMVPICLTQLITESSSKT